MEKCHQDGKMSICCWKRSKQQLSTISMTKLRMVQVNTAREVQGRCIVKCTVGQCSSGQFKSLYRGLVTFTRLNICVYSPYIDVYREEGYTGKCSLREVIAEMLIHSHCNSHDQSHQCNHPSIHPFIHQYIHLFIHPLMNPSIRPSIHKKYHEFILENFEFNFFLVLLLWFFLIIFQYWFLLLYHPSNRL